MSSKNIYNLIRGLSQPYIGAHFSYKNEEIKVWKSQEVVVQNVCNIEPGKILKINEDGSFIVKTGENCIKIIEYDKVLITEGEYL